MVDRARVTEAVQIGLESTEGTAVAAPTNIRSTSVETKIGGAADFFRPDGHKFNTLAMTNMEWSTFALNGKGTYTELCWLLAMAFGNPTPASSGVGAKTRVYTMLDTAILAPTPATLMKGNSVRAQKMAGALMADFTLAFSRKNGANLTGGGIGRLFTDGITMTASPSDVALVPIVGKQLDVYIDTTAAGLGTTKLLRAFSLENVLTGIFGPIWPMDSAQTSYAAHVDLAPTTGTKLMVEADATGMAYLSQYRADDLMFVRIKGTGAEFESGIPFSITYDTCIAIKSVSPDEDEDGVTVVTYETEMVKDTTWAKALNITVVNNIASVA